MQFQALLAATLAATALAAPTPLVAGKHGQVVGQWTIQGATRFCSADACTWTFGVNRHDGSAPQTCTFQQSGGPRTDVRSPQACGGPYTVTVGWSGQFGPDHGFSTVALKDIRAGLISYPAYDDATLANGVRVTPDIDFNAETFYY